MYLLCVCGGFVGICKLYFISLWRKWFSLPCEVKFLKCSGTRFLKTSLHDKMYQDPLWSYEILQFLVVWLLGISVSEKNTVSNCCAEYSLQPCGWRQYVPPKWWYSPRRLHNCHKPNYRNINIHGKLNSHKFLAYTETCFHGYGATTHTRGVSCLFYSENTLV
jgi:hypothetical protein